MTRRGFTLVFMLLWLTTMFAAGAMWVQYRIAALAHQEAENAADAAALAGAQAFIDGYIDSVIPWAYQTVEGKNPNTVLGRPAHLKVEVDTFGRRLRVTVDTTLDLIFGPTKIAAWTEAGADLAENGQGGKPIPKGNAWGWHDRGNATATDSAVVHIIGRSF